MAKLSVVQKLKRLCSRKQGKLLLESQAMIKRALQQRDPSYELSRAQDLRKEAAELDYKRILAMPYQPRKARFKLSSSKLDFDPATHLGHSYMWYEISKRINGVTYLNDFGYSTTTRRHYWKIASVMRALGIKFKCLEAPQGLQNLEASLDYNVAEYGKAVIAQKYGRLDKSHYVRYRAKQLRILTALGFIASDACKQAAIERADASRTERLAQARKSKAEQELQRMINRMKGINR